MLRLQGGLGNQLFQLTALRYLSETCHVSPTIYAGHLNQFVTRRQFEVKPLLRNEMVVDEISLLDQVLFSTKLSRLLSRVPLHSIESVHQLKRWRGEVLNGYFQDVYRYENKRHFRLLLAEIDKSISQLASGAMLFQSDSCAIHLRLTDFVRTEQQRRFLLEYRLPYIKKAMGWFRQRHVKSFVVFTDSVQEAKQLLPEADVTFFAETLGNETPLLHEFYSFSRFDNMIAANSTFSFWGSLMGKAKTVVFPLHWDLLNRKDEDTFQQNLSSYPEIMIHQNNVVRL